MSGGVCGLERRRRARSEERSDGFVVKVFGPSGRGKHEPDDESTLEGIIEGEPVHESIEAEMSVS